MLKNKFSIKINKGGALKRDKFKMTCVKISGIYGGLCICPL